jgi:hypothetical protein
MVQFEKQLYEGEKNAKKELEEVEVQLKGNGLIITS